MPIVFLPELLTKTEPQQFLQPPAPVVQTVGFTQKKDPVINDSGATISASDFQFSSDGFLTFESKRKLALLAEAVAHTGAKVKLESLLETNSDSEYFGAWEREMRIVDYLKHLGIPPHMVDKYIVVRA